MKLINKMLDEKSRFILIISLCFGLLMTKTLENGYIFGIIFSIILIFSNIINLIFKSLSSKIKTFTYLLFSSILIVIMEYFINKYIPALNNSLGLYLPLILISQIVFAKEILLVNKKSLLESIKIAVSFLFFITLISLFREIIESNTITLMNSISGITGYKSVYKIFNDSLLFPISVMDTLAIALLLMGIVCAFFNKLRGGKDNESN